MSDAAFHKKCSGYIAQWKRKLIFFLVFRYNFKLIDMSCAMYLDLFVYSIL